MYYVTKFIQAAGLTLILVGFMPRFPEVMDMSIFGIGAGTFAFGWILQKCLTKI